MRKTLSDRAVQALKPRATRYAHPDPELRGHYVRVQPSGSKSYAAVTLSPQGKQVWVTLGGTDVLSVEDAREKAREVIKRVKAGLEPIAPLPVPAESFQTIAERWLDRHVRAKGIRTEPEIVRSLTTYVYPQWSKRELVSIRRSDIAKLLDHIQDHHGVRQADLVLAYIRQIMNWHAVRDDHYQPPIVRGMKRQDGNARARILTDDELRAVWNAAEAGGAFGAFVQLLLLTAQRRAKVVTMRWADIADDGTWTIPTEEREKGTAGEILLPAVALGIIQRQPRIGEAPYVFAGRGNGPINSFSKSKRALDALLPKEMPQWGLHDLRRTARSLMSRAGVDRAIAERVLGHVQGGVEGIYDRHKYKAEKANALAGLASLIDGIVHPRDNVLPLRHKETV